MDISSLKIDMHDFFSDDLKQQVNKYNCEIENANQLLIDATDSINRLIASPVKNGYVNAMDSIHVQNNCYVDMINLAKKQMEVLQPLIQSEKALEKTRLEKLKSEFEEIMKENYKNLYGEKEYNKINGNPVNWRNEFKKFETWNDFNRQISAIKLGDFGLNDKFDSIVKTRLNHVISILHSAYVANLGLTGKVKQVKLMDVNSYMFKEQDKVELY